MGGPRSRLRIISNDNAETMLLNLARNRESGGFPGSGRSNGYMIRPLLGIKQEGN